MATKKEIKQVLKELNLTEEQLDAYWQELVPMRPLYQSINKIEGAWRKLHNSVIKQIPFQKEKILLEEEEERKRAEEKLLAELAYQAERDYYEDHFKEIILDKIDRKQRLEEKETRRLIWEFEYEEISSERARWSDHVITVVQLNDRFFQIQWNRGLTEDQEDFYVGQPVEVWPHTYEKMVTVTEWRMEKDNNEQCIKTLKDNP